MRVRHHLLLAALPLCLAWPARRADTPRVAVFPIALNDLANQPASPDLPERMTRLGAALRGHLASGCGYRVLAVDSIAEAAGVGVAYLYEHPDVAVALVAAQQPEWVVIPRLNRASPWVTDLQAHVVRARDSTVVSNRIVEVKGIELTPELATRLIDRGSAWMADQLSQAIEHAAGRTAAPAARRCPA